jgi:hypothetical protein
MLWKYPCWHTQRCAFTNFLGASKSNQVSDEDEPSQIYKQICMVRMQRSTAWWVLTLQQTAWVQDPDRSWEPLVWACNQRLRLGESWFETSRTNSSWDPRSKITRAKWIGSMNQAVESLLCKHEALSSNPSLTKKEKKRKIQDVPF